MVNYEIFSQTSGNGFLYFSLICIFIVSIFIAKDKNIISPLNFLVVGLIFDFLGSFTESKVLNLYNQGKSIDFYVMVELTLFLFSMIFMSLAATNFISQRKNKDAVNLPVWILGSLGALSIIFFTFIIPSGDIINNMRFIFPIAAFSYLAVGFSNNFKLPSANGYILAFSITVAIVIINILSFLNLGHISSYTIITPILYLLYAFSFLLIKNDTVQNQLLQSQHELQKSNNRFDEIIKLSPFPIVISRLSDDKIIIANNNACKLLGIENFDNYHLNDFFADSDNRRLLLEQIEAKKNVEDFEVLIKSHSSKTPFWLLTSAKIIDYNYDLALYSAFQDITSRKNREVLLQNQAMRDPLTTLFNRRYFEKAVNKQISNSLKNNLPFSLLMIDVDFFKKVNDTFGHKIGDKVLIELAAKTEKELRDNDIVARYGGEEFVIFLPEVDEQKAYKVAERLRQAVASIVVYSDSAEKVTFTVSIGVSSALISKNLDTLVKTADEALYKAKQNGRNRVEIFTVKDLHELKNKIAKMKSDNAKNIHPIYKKENSAEISLLDGADVKDISSSQRKG